MRQIFKKVVDIIISCIYTICMLTDYNRQYEEKLIETLQRAVIRLRGRTLSYDNPKDAEIIQLIQTLCCHIESKRG